MKALLLATSILVTTLCVTACAQSWKTADLDAIMQGPDTGVSEGQQVLEIPAPEPSPAGDASGGAAPETKVQSETSDQNAATPDDVQAYQNSQTPAVPAAGAESAPNASYGSISEYLNQQNDLTAVPGVPIVVLIPFGQGIQYYHQPRRFYQPYQPFRGWHRGFGGGFHHH